MSKRISIGRDQSCDMIVEERYDDVSRRHAVIYQEGSRLMLEDNSANGTFINGQKINNACREIKAGDNISLGKFYTLSWNDINRFFQMDSGRSTERYVTPPNRQEERYQEDPNQPSQRELDEYFAKWNWGAFFLGWIWGLGHRIYWPLIAFAPCFFPVGNIISKFVLGANGNKYAWRSRQWSSLDECKRIQRKWTQWGIGIYLGVIGIAIIAFIAMLSFWMSVLGRLL